MRDDLGILIQLGIISSPARLTDESLARMALYPQSVGAFVVEQSTQETVSTQDAGAERSFEAREQSKGVRSDGGGRGAKTGQKAPVGMDSQEVEWHFDVDDLGRVEGWLGEGLAGSGLVVGPGSAEDLVDAYYDTEDWRLYRAGYALRIRQWRGGGPRPR